MIKNPTDNNINRGEFLRSLGMSSAALMAFYCMGTGLTACSKSDSSTPTPTPPAAGLTGNADTAAGAINFTIDLTNSNYSSLKTVGNFMKIGSVLVANTTGGKYVTIQRLCTHEANDAVSYGLSANKFTCSAHGSVFNVDGTVSVGPATTAMKLYKSTISTDGNTLTVTA
ncbi:QcrA and Rieske domain-containing protein [Spirosoma endophyticum]|uniref:Cytochrome b6-f complex iron-sulfur subunit n=1 Tax=Spirosoma endophyticum TaxID=662367 RepID=A0A1I1T6D4_9BACT|nr:Rieske 2Fe-2S domain-containing protein [Spirosoma endophyticum]SFD54156.1 cytochrome b6-f complex iron-sulfur subunit [Spirosoma endophyticum]